MHAYISLNSHIYDSDTKKVTFTLSFCKEGAAKSWALGCYKQAMKDDRTFIFPSWKNFCEDYAKVFISSTAEQDMQQKLRSCVQGNCTTVEFSTEFQTIASKATFDEKAKCKYYIEAVHPALATKLLSTYPLPMTLNDWIEHTCTLNAQWHFDRALKQCTFHPRSSHVALPSTSKNTRDPMVMDVDSLMAEQKQ